MKKEIKLKDGRVKVQTIFDHEKEPSLTQQHHKDQCDVNKIIARAKKGAAITHLNPYQGQYQDLTLLPDYATALNTVIKANEAFMALPATVRDEFAHDPEKLIKFVADEKNYERALELGLVSKRKPVDTPTPEKPVDTPK